MKEHELGGAYGTSGVEEKYLSWRKVNKRDNLEHLGAIGGMIFVAIFQEESSQEGFFLVCIFTYLTPKRDRPLFFEFLKINATVPSI
jgi:uncharacterized membrane protein